MSRTTIKEVIGFVGVVGSLLFVGLQIRQNTIAARASAYQQMGGSLADLWLTTAQDADQAVLTMKFFEDESVEFTPVEQAVLINQTIAAFRQRETTWRQVELGLLDPEILDAFGWDAEGKPAFIRNMKQLWPRVAPFMSPDFRAFVERGFGWTE